VADFVRRGNHVKVWYHFTKSVFFKIRFCWFEGGAVSRQPLPLGVPLFQEVRKTSFYIREQADPGGRAVEGVVLLPLACWDWGFESHMGVCLLQALCVFRCRSLRHADHQPTGALPSVCVCVPMSVIKCNNNLYTNSESIERGQA
jgi:hypothetical protein